jgi:hypothetical protein
MKRINPKKGLNKRYFGIPLEKYFSQIRQICEKHGYKINGEVKVELPNGDDWTYNFSKGE